MRPYVFWCKCGIGVHLRTSPVTSFSTVFDPNAGTRSTYQMGSNSVQRGRNRFFYRSALTPPYPAEPDSIQMPVFPQRPTTTAHPLNKVPVRLDDEQRRYLAMLQAGMCVSEYTSSEERGKGVVRGMGTDNWAQDASNQEAYEIQPPIVIPVASCSADLTTVIDDLDEDTQLLVDELKSTVEVVKNTREILDPLEFAAWYEIASTAGEPYAPLSDNVPTKDGVGLVLSY